MIKHFNSDDEDYDPNAQLEQAAADKLASMGLSDVIREKKEKEAQEAAEAAAKKPTTGGGGAAVKKTPWKAGSTEPAREMTEAEKREAQLRNDMEGAADLFGLQIFY